MMLHGRFYLMCHGSMKNNIYGKFSLTVTDIVEKAVGLYGLIHCIISNKIVKPAGSVNGKMNIASRRR